ncbi:hypothetical protein [Nannocystis pusilla]|uniref:hypothetical protein n=1 Tax=Nannocystis pusilla TaxID=889268 RepID=UPI003DA40FCA
MLSKLVAMSLIAITISACDEWIEPGPGPITSAGEPSTTDPEEDPSTSGSSSSDSDSEPSTSGEEGSGSGGESGTSGEEGPRCRPVIDLVGTVIGYVCQTCTPVYDDAGAMTGEDCGCLTEPLTGLCVETCDSTCPDKTACTSLIIQGKLADVCWPVGA